MFSFILNIPRLFFVSLCFLLGQLLGVRELVSLVLMMIHSESMSEPELLESPRDLLGTESHELALGQTHSRLQKFADQGLRVECEIGRRQFSWILRLEKLWTKSRF